MKITVIGGGPAGLYFSVLMKTRRPEAQIEVFERNPRNNTFGWGVVFSARTISGLEKPEPITYSRIQKAMRTWENVDVVHRGKLTSVGGNTFSGIARIELLNILQQRCEELGVKLHFETEISEDPTADLVVAADGVNSFTRDRHQEDFKPTLSNGNNHYIWYGTEQPFGGLTLIFRQSGGGLYMAHSYKYSKDLSTFIVEIDTPTWELVKDMSDDQVKEHLEEVFADDLGGNPLLSNHSKWIRFVEVKNEHWWRPGMVLLGDALHTAHFSIGSGTKLALEDAVFLADAFDAHPDPAQALPTFEKARRPSVTRVQEAAELSQKWFEEARGLMGLEVMPFVYQAMTRSSRVDDDSLRKRDPDFVSRYRQWQAQHA